MNLSSYLGIPAGHDHLGFIDIRLDSDTPLFIDPCLIEQDDNEMSIEAEKLLDDFTQCLCSEMRSENWYFSTILNVGHEVNETKLGYGNGMNGKGKTGPGMRVSLSDLRSLAIQGGSLSKMQDIPVLVRDFAEDCMSDLETNILRRLLVQFTEKQMLMYGVRPVGESEVIEWSLEEHGWVHRVEPFWLADNVKFLLVPKQWVRKHFLFSTDSYFTRVVLEYLQKTLPYDDWKKKDIAKQLESIEKQWKFQRVVDFAIENPDSLHDYHQRMPGIYHQYGGQMTDEELDQLLYGYQVVAV